MKMRRLLCLLLSLVMLMGILPFSSLASEEDKDIDIPIAEPIFVEPGSSEQERYTVYAYAGTVTAENGVYADGQAEAGTVITVTLDETAYAGHEFAYWKSMYGDVIPKSTFRVLVDRDAYFYPVFTDIAANFGEWEMLIAGASCEDGDIYIRRDTDTGLVEYKKEYFNWGNHEFGPYEYVDEEYCTHTCNHCGYAETNEHYWSQNTTIAEATHETEGLIRSTCYNCGAVVERVIPKTTEHEFAWNDWTIIEPSVNGQYGKRMRQCKYCDYTETYWYLDVDLKPLFKNHSIRYKASYGGKVEHNEQYYSWTREDGKIVYIWATQYAYAYSSGNDNGQTWIFMFIDDEDPTVLKPVYLSKSTGSGASRFLWAHYGYAYDFDGWIDVLDSPDFALTDISGITIGNTMGARASALQSWTDDWAEVYNAQMIPVTEDPDSFITTTGDFKQWEVYQEGVPYAKTSVYIGEDENGDGIWEYYGGFDDCTEYRRWVSGSDETYKVYDYITVDKDTGIAVSKTDFTTYYTTRDYFESYREIISAEEFNALDENMQRGYVNVENIEDELKAFCWEQGRNSFYDFSLTVPEKLTAVRVLVNGNFTIDQASNWNYSYNPARVFFVPLDAGYSYSYKLSFSWNEENAGDSVFDRWETYNFHTKEWETLSEDPSITINTYENPLEETTFIRTVSHIALNEETCHIKVNDGTFNRITANDIIYYDAVGDVPVDSYIYPMVNYEAIPAGMQFDHWTMLQNGEEVEIVWDTYRYSQCIKVNEDVEFVPVYVPAQYYVDAYAENGTVYKDGEEFWGGAYEAGTVLNLTTEGYEDYPYFYGWYLMSEGGKEDGGSEEEVMLSSNTALVYTVPARYPRLVAKWGNTPEQPRTYHDITVVNGFAQRYNGLKLSDLRVNDYNSLDIYTDPICGLDITLWTMVGTFENGDAYEQTAEPYYGSAGFWIGSSDEVPYLLTITGSGEAVEEPTPEPTEEPTPEPTEEPTPEPTEEPTPEPTEEPVHEHDFGSDYRYDEFYHWLECECGERAQEELHSFGEWTDLEDAATVAGDYEIRICEVCGYSEVREKEIPKEEKSLIILKKPDKYNYAIGEDLDLNGIVLAIKEAGEYIPIDSDDCLFLGFDSTNPGPSVVTIIYETEDVIYTNIFTLRIDEPAQVTGIALVTKPQQLLYTEGDELDLSGLSILVHYSDGRSGIIPGDDLTVTGYDPTVIGNQFLTVSYQDQSTGFTVTVKKTPEIVVTGVGLSVKPTKQSYEVGEALDTTGLRLFVKYSDGTTEIISEGFEVTGYDAETIGNQRLTVSYKGSSTGYTVKVSS